MIPYQQSSPSSFPCQTEVDPTKGVALATVALPVMQMTNTQEVPATSLSKFAKIQSQMLALVDSAEAQERIFPSIMQVLLGAKEFTVADERKASRIVKGRSFERLHYRNSIYYALHSTNLLFILKIHLAKIINLQKQRNSGGKIYIESQLVKTALASFCKSGKCYYALLEKLNAKDSNLPFAGEGYNQQARSISRIKAGKETLEATKKKYNDLLTGKGIKPEEVQAELFDFANSNIFLRVIYNAFNQMEQRNLEAKLKELLQAPQDYLESEESDETPSTSAEVFSALLLADDSIRVVPIPRHLEFKNDRKPASFEFYDSLKNVTDPMEHRAKFFEFLLADWEPKQDYDEQLKESLLVAKSKTKPNLKAECIIVLEMCLHKRLKNHAASLIKHILRIKKDQLALNKKGKLRQVEIRTINKRISFSLNYLRKVVNIDYKNNFIDFKQRLNIIESLSLDELKKTIVEIYRIRNNARKLIARESRDGNLTSPVDLLYINQVLYLLREKPDFISKNILDLARFYSKEESQSKAAASTSVSSPQPEHSLLFYQDLQKPAAKRRALEVLEGESSQNAVADTQDVNDQSAKPCTSQQAMFAESDRLIALTVDEVDTEFALLSYFDEAQQDIGLLQDMELLQDIQARGLNPPNLILQRSACTSEGETSVLNFTSNTHQTASE